MTSKTDGVDTYTYSWSEDNQLVGVELNSSPVVSYEYDSGSRMLQRIEGSTSTNYHWDAWDLVREEKDDGVATEITNYLVPQGEVLAFQRDGDWFYLHGDGLSSTQLVTDESGAQVGRAVYGAWGETLSFNESVPGSLDVRFVGGLGVRNDAATGLIYMRHRWYDSELGRFISRDPIGLAGGNNLYSYPDNPLTFIDPSGLQTAAIPLGTDVIGTTLSTLGNYGGKVIGALGTEVGAGSLGGVTGVVGVAGAVGSAVIKSYEQNQIIKGQLIKSQSQLAVMMSMEINEVLRLRSWIAEQEAELGTQSCRKPDCLRSRVACFRSAWDGQKLTGRELQITTWGSRIGAMSDGTLATFLKPGGFRTIRLARCELAYRFCMLGGNGRMISPLDWRNF